MPILQLFVNGELKKEVEIDFFEPIYPMEFEEKAKAHERYIRNKILKYFDKEIKEYKSRYGVYACQIVLIIKSLKFSDY